MTQKAHVSLVNFTANFLFELKAGTSYWLVRSDPSVATANGHFTASNVYQSSFGYGLPSFNASWSSTSGNGQGSSVYGEGISGLPRGL